MLDDANASTNDFDKNLPIKKRRRKSTARRTKELMNATDSAIERLEIIARPGGEIEQMDIKELKNLISSIRDLASVANELSGEQTHPSGGVIVLPEVQIHE